MAHIRLEWVPDRLDGKDIVMVDVLVGPHRRAARVVGQLELHASEVNALDRLLSYGAQFEGPAHTYEIVAREVLWPASSLAAAGNRR